MICHNDVAHHTTVFQAGRPVAFIDWDFAAPGPRAWDVAYAAYRFVSLVPDRGGLVETILDRVQAVCELIVGRAAEGDPFFQQHLAEGHLDAYQRDLVFIRSLRQPLQEALSAGP